MSQGRAWIEAALALFREACELPEDQRAAFLDGRCGQDAELRRHVEAMLARDAEELPADAESPLPVHAVLSDLARAAESIDPEPLPEVIGGYRIVRLLAEGGMGVVYEAEQEQPRRRVALKVAKVSGAMGERAQRFALEAQLLARLEHPGIARIIEAGTTGTEAGARPFFAMEFVEGQPLTDFAVAHLQTSGDKLALMVSVCDAVGYAHRQGVIHRDLKPDNVFVDAEGRPKVLDFGVAKVQAAAGFGAATLRTEAGRVLGTLGYMAPEQLGGETEGLGPAADVYSLGVMLYELLTGRLPHDLTAATPTRALAIVSTTEAPLLGVVRPEYRGDIEALVAKALEKDPRHRYADAVALQADLERLLRGEPTLARPAGPLQRLAKWTRRRPAQATAVFGLFAALAAVAGVLVVMNRQVKQALDEFELLRDSKRLERAAIEADETMPAAGPDDEHRLPLHTLPARRDKVDAMAKWRTSYADLDQPDLLAKIYRPTLDAIRSRATQHAGETWSFDDPLQQLKHDVLAKMVADFATFQQPNTGLFARMKARQATAETIEQQTVEAHRTAWYAAIERIHSNPLYHDLLLAPQVGLVPLGQDPDSHFEEFLHLETHVGDIPVMGERSHLLVTGDTGIVFVLIPGTAGEKIQVGAQNSDPTADFYDARAVVRESDDPQVRVGWELLRLEAPLEPFFLSKYEMTQGQWLRTMGQNPAFPPSQSLDRPVNMVSWDDCDWAMRRLGLRLPTEWEWEYAARAGTTTAFWTGREPESLQDKENLFEAVAAVRFKAWSGRMKVDPAPWDDTRKKARFDAILGDSGPAPVGSYPDGANGFGLFDVAGNVAEWTFDPPFQGRKARDRGNAIEHQGRLMKSRIVRGGSMKRGVDEARSAARRDALPNFFVDEVGLRPAMDVQH